MKPLKTEADPFGSAKEVLRRFLSLLDENEIGMMSWLCAVRHMRLEVLKELDARPNSEEMKKP
jgi:hypothetical protein